jgi:hypothetical protein
MTSKSGVFELKKDAVEKEDVPAINPDVAKEAKRGCSRTHAPISAS